MKVCLDLHTNMAVNNCLIFINVGRRNQRKSFLDLCASHINSVAKICGKNVRIHVKLFTREEIL